MTYNTKQKDLILDIIKKQKYPFTIKDIYNLTNQEVGLTTIYRLVDSLVSDGYLNKEIGNDNNTYYQYIDKCDEENHFYLKCTNCGQIIHVDCSFAEELSKHITSHHNFRLSKEHIIINGICSDCSSKEIHDVR